MLDDKTRYLQIAFNGGIDEVNSILPRIPRNERIIIEAGTPYIKREGARGIRRIAQLWGGKVVADMKTADGAADEVDLAMRSGATAATVLGSASTETLNLFIAACKAARIDSMIDLIGVEDPLDVVRKLRDPPNVVILHRGRDEETTRGKVIQYKHVKRIRSKYDVIISAAGGVDLREARSAIFNGANIVVVNIVSKENPWTGIRSDENITEIAQQFLDTIE